MEQPMDETVKMILFDLDGTLLPMDQDEFTGGYFRLLAKKMAPYGYDPAELVKNVWAGTKAMVMNDGKVSNAEAFWRKFEEIYGRKGREDEPVFEEVYRENFVGAKAYCGYNKEVPLLVSRLKEAGYRVALATNPLFPAIATEQRIRWAGCEPSDFELVTTYENINYCKPNPDYYREVASRLSLRPEECLMVGNDVDEDMVAETIGMKVFLLTDCLLNRKGKEIGSYAGGSFPDLAAFLGLS